MRYSIAVLKASAVNTLLMAIMTNSHSVLSREKNIPAAITIMAMVNSIFALAWLLSSESYRQWSIVRGIQEGRNVV